MSLSLVSAPSKENDIKFPFMIFSGNASPSSASKLIHEFQAYYKTLLELETNPDDKTNLLHTCLNFLGK